MRKEDEVTDGQDPILQGLEACRPWEEVALYLIDGKPLADIELGGEVLLRKEAILAPWGEETVVGSPSGGSHVRSQ